MTELSTRRTIWIDVEDLFVYFAANPRPSGIQRLMFEILCVVSQRGGLRGDVLRVAFVRHGGDDVLHEVPLASVAALFERQRPAPAPVVAAPQPRRRAATKSIVKRLRLGVIRRVERMPPEVADALLRAGVLQIAALRHAAALIRRGRPRHDAKPGADAPVSGLPPVAGGFPCRPGDVFLLLGAPWRTQDYGVLLRRLRLDFRLTPALLLYDLIPVRHPEWCTAELVEDFAAWLAETLPQCDRLMAISRSTAADVESYARETGLKLARPVKPIPIGTGFGALAGDAALEAPRGLPAPGSYVLFVSTMEARKNHALLFRIWRQLLSDMPAGEVPTLVFAGRVGWLVADLLQQLENTNWLDGRIRLLRDPTDAELVALYRGCLFTVFPSLFEGWGLPVSESLALGCPCLASDRTSLPEAGGSLARYFDPEDLAQATEAVRAIISDRSGLAAWRERVGREFHPVPWEATADAILDACLAGPAAAPAAAVLEHAT